MTTITPENLNLVSNTANRGYYDIKELAYQLFNDIPNRKVYLEKFEARELEYEKRVNASRLINYYRDTLDFYVCSIGTLDFAKSRFISIIRDIDGLQNDLTAFLNIVDQLALMYGGVWIDVTDATKLVVVTEKSILSTNETETTYTTFDNKRVKIPTENLISYWYDRGIPEPGKLVFNPLFKDIINNNMALFIASSEYDALVRLYGNPVLVRVDNRGLNMNAGQSRAPIDFREKNRIVDLDLGGELYFLGLAETNAAVLRERISSLTDWLEGQKQMLIPMSTLSVAHSPTEIMAAQDQNKRMLKKFTTRKNNNIQSVLSEWLKRHHPQFVNEANVITVILEEEQPEILEDTDLELKEEKPKKPQPKKRGQTNAR